MPHATVRSGVSLYYEWHGHHAGDPVIFIRGTGADSSRWMPQVEEYAGRYRCLIFDNRGAGKSDTPAGPYSVDMMVEDAIGLMDALSIESAHLSGLSLGGAIAQAMTLAAPARVTTLQLHGTWARTYGYARKYLSLLRRFVLEGGLDLYYEGALLYLFPPDYITEQPERMDGILQAMKKNSSPAQGLLGQLEANLTHDVLDRLDQIAVPTLVTVGELDMCLPPYYARELHRGIRNSELVVFKGGSHLFGLQDPATFNRVTLEWLGRQVALLNGKKGGAEPPR